MGLIVDLIGQTDLEEFIWRKTFWKVSGTLSQSFGTNLLMTSVRSDLEHEQEGVIKFIEQANNYHRTIKFTAEISETEINFLDTTIYRDERFNTESVLD